MTSPGWRSEDNRSDEIGLRSLLAYGGFCKCRVAAF